MRSLAAGYRLKSMRFSTNGKVSKAATTENASSRTNIARTVSPNSFAANALATRFLSNLIIAPTRSRTWTTLPKLCSGSAYSSAAKATAKAKLLYGGGGSHCRKSFTASRFALWMSGSWVKAAIACNRRLRMLKTLMYVMR
jgi:hypothetical protein